MPDISVCKTILLRGLVKKEWIISTFLLDVTVLSVKYIKYIIKYIIIHRECYAAKNIFCAKCIQLFFYLISVSISFSCRDLISLAFLLIVPRTNLSVKVLRTDLWWNHCFCPCTAPDDKIWLLPRPIEYVQGEKNPGTSLSINNMISRPE